MQKFVVSMASTFILHFLVIFSSLTQLAYANSKLFREYIGAENQNVQFSDVPINSNIDFHFILSFAIDYTNTSIPLPTNGNFKAYWDTENLKPQAISTIKSERPNVKVAVSLGGDTVNGQFVYFNADSIDSWVGNATNSITQMVKEHGLDGIDIDYEHFQVDPDTFAECIGRLLCNLKENNIVSFTSIAPYGNESVQEHYSALWKKYSHVIDYVNFQFYAYPKNTTIAQFLEYFEAQSCNYEGGKILLSFGTDTSGGLKPEHGFFTAASILRSWGKIHGIFIWSADDSKAEGFRYEKQAQDFLASR